MNQTKQKSKQQKPKQKVKANKPPKRDPRWHVAANTPYGQFSAGSGDKANNLSSARSRMTDNVNGDIVYNSRTVQPGSRVEEQEELVMAEVQCSAAFRCTELRFQPARDSSFPWLYEIARKFQKWVCLEAEYEYRSNTSIVSPSGSAGRVVLAFNYDSLDPNLSTLQQAETIQPHAAGKPVDTIILRLDPGLLNGSSSTGKFCRPGAVPAGGDLKSYDGGILYVATSGFNVDGAVIGEVYVRYRVRLLQPIITGMTVSPTQPSSFFGYIPVDGAELNNPSGPALTQVVNWQNGGTTPPGVLVSLWNGIEAAFAGYSIQLPAGRYHLRCYVTVRDVIPTQSRLSGAGLAFTRNGAVDLGASMQAGFMGLAVPSNLACNNISMVADFYGNVAAGDVLAVAVSGTTPGSTIGVLVMDQNALLFIETI